MGGSWPIMTMVGNKYNIYFEKTNIHGFFQMFNGEYYVSLVQGHEKAIVEILTNVIEDSKVMK